MTDQTLQRLAEADPAGQLDPVPPDDLLARILAAEPAAPAARRTRSRPLRVAAVAAAIVLAVVAATLTIGPRGSTSLALAAQAYAQTTADGGDILYTRVATLRTETTSEGTRRETGTIEEWLRGDESHRLQVLVSDTGRRLALDHVIGPDGVMHQVTGDGGYRIVRRSDNEDAANVIASERAGFVQEFRRSYERGDLDEATDVEFAGRPARRYVVAAQGPPERRPPTPEHAYYVDRETGAPLGSTTTFRMAFTDGNGPAVPTTMRWVQTVEAIERLEPTAENLEKLRTHVLPRRRDAEGCIRGPVTDARTSDTAPRRDCGGKPGAPLR
jgi:hypothetical protein